MNPPCKRCLLAEIGKEELYETVRRRIAQMPEEERAEEALYQARLEKCKRCEMLREGICGACGCFAELRAARNRMHCPNEKW